MAKPKSLHPKRGNNQRNVRNSKNLNSLRNSRNSSYSSRASNSSRTSNSRVQNQSNSRVPSYNPRDPRTSNSNLNSSLIFTINLAKFVISKAIAVALTIIGVFVMLLKKDEPIAFGLNFRKIFAIVIIILIAAVAVYSFTGTSDSEVKSVTIGSNSTGNVVREGPYGDSDSPNKIAIILGTHPRESGAHNAMYKALKNNAKDLNACYYVYKINVVNGSSGFEESRMEGQKLAKAFVVNDIVSNNFTFAVDTHYSNGNWGVPRFVFTPVEENNVAYKFANDISAAFSWLDYYNPGSEASSPAYLTAPLNRFGIPAIIYEAYTEDDNNVTYNHDVSFIKFLDNYDWENVNSKSV